MHDMTAGNLRSAYGGESMAHMRYIRWSDKAATEGFPNVARLFRAISYAEQVHATGHFNAMSNVGGGYPVTSMAGFGVGTTVENLAGAIEGENFEVSEMYPAFLAVARDQAEKGAERSFTFAVSAEKIHAALFEQARRSVEGGKDVELGPVHVCEICGHTIEGDAPDKCPICNTTGKKFRTFA
jgi:rubrerythrin